MTNLEKQVEEIIKKTVAEALQEEALRLYRRELGPILKQFDKQLKEIQNNLKA